jgi:hypothetical protein
MKIRSKYPVIYEINTAVWLNELSAKYQTNVTLATVVEAEWDYLESLGIDAVWFMGVWERSPAGVKIASSNQNLMSEFKTVLPDFQDSDLIGSAYCVKNYNVDTAFGGTSALASARKMLARRGIGLILDFVPNHVAPDHPWTVAHPQYFIRGTESDIRQNSSSYIKIGENILALGRDPFFPAWPDVVQLNAFNADLRRAAADTLTGIAAQCDGVRCDMAMLLLNHIFENTWGTGAGQKPAEDYWQVLIQTVRSTFPNFLFIAEAYWELEWELQQQGFDFCYDKKLYDRMEHHRTDDIRSHLLGEMSYQNKLIRFIENHDEPRAASSFSVESEKIAAVMVATLPGARLFHDGQFEGRKKRVPVFLAKRPPEETNSELQLFYRQLLTVTNDETFRNGHWCMGEIRTCADCTPHPQLLAWYWRTDTAATGYLIVINYSDRPAQGLLRLNQDELSGTTLHLTDLLSDVSYERSGSELFGHGIYIALEPWNCHFFRLK